ncbi:hypothetical protein KMW28_11920 [Flammeovirga yaeyamensis]|uniref:Uncharacterized protein n=1 Tax=Flammeovirga yaeyamensis TaxID=367791 RepID=A0AAX1MYF0_9BACT|nr:MULTISPECIES: hypothetical protein [Flammeovirga]ANQ48213.1 hypothetical protein MY04_0831 [Flammeovirga sp. MY04]MBB3696129.1 hypothetical protein [Flammeovirga yaeyamensis]NMF34813.1 hypothetical protein [Flammeovirga yaeyamensis]QWG00359.1 hypothetical protein KMW28_11920 [Flammeovirga yaeyamensis]
MIYFKRWSRKGYSIFNTLKKVVKICVVKKTVQLTPCVIENHPRIMFIGLQKDDDDPLID